MPKRIARCVYNINDFPDDVLSHIISFLPFKEAVCTSILSTRWRNLFTLLTDVDLEINGDGKEVEEDESEQFMNFVDRLLLLEKPSIQRFRLHCHDYPFPKRVKKWIDALVLHNLQELDLWIDCENYYDWPLPLRLFCCESLVVLKLNLKWGPFTLELPDRIFLPNLKVLHFEEAQFPYHDDGSEDRLFPNCPVLEDLVLTGCFNYYCSEFKVSNQNLKTLTLADTSEIRETSFRVLINAPNLVLLNYDISMYLSIVLQDVKPLPKAIIDGCVPDAPGALGEIQNVQALEINFKVLKDLLVYDLPIPLFDKLTCLKIWNRELRFDPIWLEYFLAHCVVLETLVLQELSFWSDKQVTSNQYPLQKSQLVPLLRHLRTIEIELIDIAEAEIFMGVIEFFLENAMVLEEMKIHSKKGRRKQKVKIMSLITSFPKASKNCRVLI